MRSMLIRRWRIVVPLLALTLLVASLVEYLTPSSYIAEGVVLVAAPEFDPSRTFLRGIDLQEMVDDITDEQGREQIVEQGGSAQYQALMVGPRRIQVLVPADATAAVPTAETVLRTLGRHINQAQERAEVPEDERVRIRLLLEVPALEPDVENGQAQPSDQVIGTVVLQDPIGGDANLFTVQQQARLLMSTLNSDAERERIEARTGLTTFELRQADRRSPGSIYILLRGLDPTTTLDAFDVVVGEIADQLEDRQLLAQIPVGRRQIVEVLAAPQEAADMTPGVHLRTVLIALVGIGLTWGAAMFLDRGHASKDRASRQTAHAQPSMPSRVP